jgi:O-antigen ligase
MIDDLHFDIDSTYQILLVMLAFLMPLTVFGGNLIIVIICLIWIFSGNYSSKFNLIIGNKLMLASIVFFCLHLLGLFWTEDLSWGLHIVHKMWYFLLLLPILFTIVKKENIKYYISAFLFAITLTEILSYLVWFEIIPPFKNATVVNPTPLMSHISYNPILAFATYLVLHEIFFNKKISNLLFFFYSFFSISMTINMFITGGRAGQVGFFVMLSVLIFQVFDKSRFNSLLVILFIIPGIFFTAYSTSDLFHSRVDLALKETINYTDQDGSSVGLRINFAINSWQLIRDNPILGVGTGDFPNEYFKVNQTNSPELPSATNPHNMYTLVAAQLGLVGLISLLSLFYFQLKLSINSSSKFIRDVGITLPLMFLVMMLSDSYLLGHYTTLMYVFFSSFLYKDFENN